MSAKEYPVDDSYDSIAPRPARQVSPTERIESALVGCVLVLGRLPERPPRSDEFLTETLRVTWEAILAMAKRGEGIDIVAVASELEKTGRLARAGGYGALAAINDRPSPDLLEEYGRAVSETAILRRRKNWATR